MYAREVVFEGRVELLKPRVGAFVELVDQGHSGNIKRGLESISEVAVCCKSVSGNEQLLKITCLGF